MFYVIDVEDYVRVEPKLFGLDTKTAVEEQLNKSNYLILPSQRIFKPRLLHETLFPKGNKFYTDLFSEKLGYEKIYQTPCDLFCTILYLGDPVWRFEQTANVFDRPTIFIFQQNFYPNL